MGDKIEDNIETARTSIDRVRLERHAINLMKARCFSKDEDFETDHINADNILCDVLIILGYNDLVALYKDIEKYYS